MGLSAYSGLVLEIASLSGIPPELIGAHIMAESSWNPGAVHRDADGISSYGLMQVRLDTGRRLLSDPGLTPGMLLGPRLNVMAGVRLIQENLQRFGALPDAVAAYNAGVPRKNAAGQYTNSKGDTMVQRYVDRVLSYYQTYLSGAPLGPVGLSTAAALGIGGAVVLGIAIWLLSSGD